MNKKIIALAVAAAAASTSTHALEVYNDETNTFSVGGRLAVSPKFNDDSNSLNSQSSRINFAFTHALANGWDLGAKAEWAYDALSNGGNHTSNRLGQITADKEGIGHFTVGKAWAVRYDATNKTDVFWVYGGDVAGNYDGISGDGGVHGTGRADDVIQYRTNINGLQIGLQYQFEDSSLERDDNGVVIGGYDREYGYQAMAGYQFDFGLGLDAAYSQANFADRADAKVANVVVSYETEVFSLAANYGQSRNHQTAANYFGANSGAETTDEGAIKEATSLEVAGIYYIDQVQLMAGYYSLTDDNTDAKYAYGALSAAYKTGPMIFAAEYKIDTGSENASGNDLGNSNELALLARYNF
ncbi:porin [Photobacterium sanctipauli]|uniref:Porin n=1 Tax=Photobacterium sanctipauli TaxID=1342794 RepID=A0A2T3NZ56_9GAMM|nr:porin [Photobacterium sanctipauli]PSW21520.1 porin [Photobacterium sanctipauli]